MGETSGENPPLAPRSRPWGARQRNCHDPTFAGFSAPAPSPSAPHHRDLDLSLRVPGSRLGSCGAMIRMSVGVAVRREASTRLSPDSPRYGRAPSQRCFVTTSPRPRYGGLSLERQHFLAPLLDIESPISEVSPSGRVGIILPRRPRILCQPPQGHDP